MIEEGRVVFLSVQIDNSFTKLLTKSRGLTILQSLTTMGENRYLDCLIGDTDTECNYSTLPKAGSEK
jgi:hypothetical protein